MKKIIAITILALSAMAIGFVLGRAPSTPAAAQAVAAPKGDWFDQLPDVPTVPPEQMAYTFVDKEMPKDMRETMLRAHYLNQMREQELRRQKQMMDAEIEWRRIKNEHERWQNWHGTFSLGTPNVGDHRYYCNDHRRYGCTHY
jgi:membrane-bound lytic murein transglycosylase B